MLVLFNTQVMRLYKHTHLLRPGHGRVAWQPPSAVVCGTERQCAQTLTKVKLDPGGWRGSINLFAKKISLSDVKVFLFITLR